MENIRVNKVQKAAFELIQSDARFLNTIIDINTNAKILIVIFNDVSTLHRNICRWCRTMVSKNGVSRTSV